MSSLLLQTDLVPQQFEMVSMMTSASNSLLNVINDLLDFSSVQYGKLKMEFSTFNLRSLIEDVVMSLSLMAQSNDIEFGFRVHKDCPENVHSDEKRLRQILTNLLNNAIKFTHQGQIIVHVKPCTSKLGLRTDDESTHDDEDDQEVIAKKMKKKSINDFTSSSYTSNSTKIAAIKKKRKGKKDNYILFEVIDTGIGIKKEDMKKLFRRFSQIEDSYIRKYQGTGLGLVITKMITELLGGC